MYLRSKGIARKSSHLSRSHHNSHILYPREHSHVTSDVFGSFLTYLPTGLIRYSHKLHVLFIQFIVSKLKCYIHFRQILISLFIKCIEDKSTYANLRFFFANYSQRLTILPTNGFKNTLLLPFCGHKIFLPRSISLHSINFSRNDFTNFQFRTLKFEPIRNEYARSFLGLI